MVKKLFKILILILSNIYRISFCMEEKEIPELPLEIYHLICEKELESVVSNNSIFEAMEEVQIFLNIIILVNKDFNYIARYLGWNNNILDNNNEPRYRALLKYRLSFDESFLLKIKSREPGSMIDEECIEDIAKMLILGLDPDIKIRDVPLLILLIKSKKLHKLIHLMILKKVDINCRDSDKKTALMHAIEFPEVLRMLLESDQIKIELVDKFGMSALDKAISGKNIESEKMLIDKGALPNRHLKVMISCIVIFDTLLNFMKLIKDMILVH